MEDESKELEQWVYENTWECEQCGCFTVNTEDRCCFCAAKKGLSDD